MKKNNSIFKHQLLLKYLEQNNIKLPQSTLQLLKSNEPIAKQYFNLFTLSPRVINFCLQNPLAFDPAIYNFVMSLSQDYDEATVYRYLKEVLYQPENLVINATDNRIPKLDKFDYVATMSILTSVEDINLAYKALLHPLFRDKYYQEEIAIFAFDSAKRKSLNDKIKMVDDAASKISTNIRKRVEDTWTKNVTFDEFNLIRAFFETLIYYEDFESANQFLKMNDLTKYYNIFNVVIQAKNIDEFNVVRRFMIMLVNYINQKDNIYNENDLEWLAMRENDIPRLINKNMEKYYQKGYLHICFMLENMQVTFDQAKENPYVRRQK